MRTHHSVEEVTTDGCSLSLTKLNWNLHDSVCVGASCISYGLKISDVRYQNPTNTSANGSGLDTSHLTGRSSYLSKLDTSPGPLVLGLYGDGKVQLYN